MGEFCRAIFVLETTDLAGGVRVVFEQANRLAAVGVQVEIYSLQGQPDWFDLRVPIYRFSDHQILGHALRRQRAAKIATYWATAPIVAANASEGEGFYLVQDLENWFYWNDPQKQAEVLATYNLPLRMICESKWVRDQLGQLGRTSTYVGIGIDIDVFRPVAQQTKQPYRVLVNAPRGGILWHLKGMDTLVAALEIVARKEPRLDLVSFSTANYSLNIPGIHITHFTRPSDQTLASLYSSAVCFALASRHEGFCLPALESMACGCSVVATRAGGNEEFCIHNETCLLVEPEDPSALAKAILSTFIGEPMSERIRERGLIMVQSYDWRNVIRKLLAALGFRLSDYDT
jgi:glycosyltransferase involved in cell wall biosynthesis